MRLLWRMPWAVRKPSTREFANVLVPLRDAHLYSHAARKSQPSTAALHDSADDERRKSSGHDDDDDSDDDNGDDNDDNDNDGIHSGRSHGLSGFNGPEETAGMLPRPGGEYSLDGLRRTVRLGSRGPWTEYELKSRLINKAIQDIGMGRYNWQLFVLCGFGWFADNLWMQGVSLILPSLSAEFGIAEKEVRYTTSALFLGLCFGSFFWGTGSDVLGRRLAFNCTLLITSVFGTAAAYASSWAGVCLCVAALGFGVGGNLPVDGALFLEFLPDASSSLLTLLSVWWPVGQLCSSLLAWLQIAGSSSSSQADVDNAAAAWRRFVTTIGLLTFAMFAVRCFAFRLFESPKFLLSRGRQAEAVAVIHGLAHRNVTKTWLTDDLLDAVADGASSSATADDDATMANSSCVPASPPSAAAGVLRSRLAAVSADRLRPLFRSRKLAITTVLIWAVWATIGLGYPLFNAFLPQYLSHGSHSAVREPADGIATTATATTNAVYRSYAITSIMGVPGSLLAAYTVDSPSPFLGRRGTLAISTGTSAVFLFLFVRLGRSPGAQLLFSCIEAFAQNIMYGVLYAFTPEIFPAPIRGAGTGVASFLNRVTGLVAPVLAATLPGDGSTAPIYLSAVLTLLAFVGIVLIPIETRGRQRL